MSTLMNGATSVQFHSKADYQGHLCSAKDIIGDFFLPPEIAVTARKLPERSTTIVTYVLHYNRGLLLWSRMTNGENEKAMQSSGLENVDSKEQEGIIRCIFFSEFHHIAGPKITCQVSLCVDFVFRSNDISIIFTPTVLVNFL